MPQRPLPKRTHPRRTASGFTLVELLIVVAIMGIIAGMVIPQLEPGVASQLEAAGGIVVTDLDYARQLAVANQSSYAVEFAADGTQYTVTHTGSNTSLDTLPSSPFRRPTDPADQHISRFADLPQAGLRVSFLAMEPTPAVSAGNRLEFGPLGSLSSGTPTRIWLTGGQGRSRFYLPIMVNAVTGLAVLGEMTSANPVGTQSTVVVSP